MMKETTQAFMNVLIKANVQEQNVKAIVSFLWDNPVGMDEVVAFIKENPTATESDIIRKADDVWEKSWYPKYREGLIALIHSINVEIPLKEENQVLIVYKLNTVNKICEFNEWVKEHLDNGELKATEEEIVRAAVKAGK